MQNINVQGFLCLRSTCPSFESLNNHQPASCFISGKKTLRGIYLSVLSVYNKTCTIQVVYIMPRLTPQELVEELEAFARSPPVESEKEPGQAQRISSAANKLVLSLEKPADVVARLFLSQVRLSGLPTILGIASKLTIHSLLNNLQSASHLVWVSSKF